MQNSVFVGSHYLLYVCPVYFMVFIQTMLYSGIPLLRWIREGKAYDIAWSSKFGDNIFLALFIISAGVMLQQPDYQPSSWMESKIFHSVVGAVSVITSIIYGIVTKPKHPADRYHAFVLFPIYLYLVTTCLPVYYDQPWNSSWFLFGLILLFGWFVLVLFDIAQKRMNQREWISIHHSDWKFKN